MMLFLQAPVTRALERWPELLLAAVIVIGLGPIIFYLFKKLEKRNEKDIEYREKQAEKAADESRELVEKIVEGNERAVKAVAESHERAMRGLSDNLVAAMRETATEQKRILEQLPRRRT